VLFLAAALALLLVPGPAVVFIVARSVHQGRRAGLVSAIGVGTGSLVHVTGATLGLSALLLSSATAFATVKFAGAAYLVWLGVRTLLDRGGNIEAMMPVPRSLAQIWRQGVVVNVLNPKTAMFFLAFLPQFVDPSRGAVAAQTLLLGGLFVITGICTDSLYAIVAGTAGGWMRANPRFLRVQRAVTGAVFIGLGVTTAAVGRTDG